VSRLLVLTTPELADGFRLVGVETHAASHAAAAGPLLSAWLDGGEEGLVAIDEGLLAGLEPALLRRLETSERLLSLEIPSALAGRPPRRRRLGEVIQRAIGLRIGVGEEVGEVGRA